MVRSRFCVLNFSTTSRIAVLNLLCFLGVIGVTYPGSVDSVDEAVFKSITQAYLVSTEVFRIIDV